MDIKIVIPVWGNEYIEVLKKIVLPSHLSAGNLEFVSKLVDILSPNRAEKYDEWIKNLLDNFVGNMIIFTSKNMES